MCDNKKNIICVIVTYNRLSLLKESIGAVKAQTYPVSRILIIDNHSTDGTADYLAPFTVEADGIEVITMPVNVGGSGGFSEGIKRAALHRADWIWVMDDDTVPTPAALAEMMCHEGMPKLGFMCSKVVWTDGEPHKMNIPEMYKPHETERSTLLKDNPLPDDDSVVPIKSASFVSVLIKGDIPFEVGLPYKEFFIWSDDIEYTRRFTAHGYIGLFATKSLVVHKTDVNYVSSLDTIPAAAAWKLTYGERNVTFLKRKRKGWVKFLFSYLNTMRVHLHRVKRRHLPKDEEQALLKAIRTGMWRGLWFSPKIEYIAHNQA